MKPFSIITITVAALAAAGFGLGSCGRVADEDTLQIDSNTNWLMRCDADDQCSGSLRCYCGQCSQPCSQSEQCSLLAGAECASSGGAVCSNEPSVGGLCVLGCSQDADCGLDFSCTAGQCVAKPCVGNYQSWDELYAAVASDLARLDADDARVTRYVSMANHALSGACESERLAARQGLSKLVNSLSLSTTITEPVQVDAEGTLFRINLRDYDWDRTVAVGNVVYTDAWEALVASDPYAIPFVGDDADDAVADSGARVPVLFASSLANSATIPEVYAALLQIPANSADLFADLGVDPAAPDARAGYSQVNEIIASHYRAQTRAGYIWQFAMLNAAPGDLFANPLQVPGGSRELVYSLPNGLAAYVYTDSNGVWLSSSDDYIDAEANDFRARAPRFPMRMHWPRTLVQVDEVRTFVQASVLPASLQSAILLAYPGADAIESLVQNEFENQTRPALAAAGVDWTLPEPVSAMLSELDRDVDLEAVAGDLLMQPDDVENNLILLDPTFEVLGASGRLDRDDFSALYRDALCVLSAVQENTPDPSECR